MRHRTADLVRFIRRTFGAISVSVLLAAGIFVALFALRAGDEGWARHSREVSRLGREIEIVALERESALRGNSLAGSPVDPVALDIGNPRTRARLDSLRSLSRDNATQQRHADRIALAFARWDSTLLALSNPADSGRASGNERRAVTLSAPVFSEIVSEINSFLQFEDGLYGQRMAATHRLDRIIAVSGALALVILMGALWLIRQRLMEQAQQHSVSAAALDLRNAQLIDQTGQLERQQSELTASLKALRESEGRFRTLVDSLSDVVFTIGHDRRFTGMFGGAAIAGPQLDLEQFIGKTAIEILGPELGRVHSDAADRALRGEPFTYEWSQPGPAGVSSYVTSIAPLKGSDGTILGAVGINRDVTEQLQRERALTDAREQLRAAQRLDALGQLAGGVAHDFNNLLTIVLTYAAILREDANPESDEARSLDQITAASERAAALTRQLLAFSRRQVLKPQPIDLNTTVREVERMLRRLLPPDITLDVNVAPDLGLVMADPGQIEQVLVNLAINARDAMPDGGTLTMTTANVPEGQPSATGLPAAHVLVTVGDTGVGMSPEVASQVFEPFFTTKQFGRGQGLGLATVHGIVEQSGGRVTVESELGRGTRFYIRLPQASQPAKPVSPPIPPLVEPGGGETVLLVDDNEELRRVVKRMLMRAGYDVLEAANGASALAQLDRGVTVDIVISDVMMPEMSGKALMDAIRQRHQQVKLLLMSGYNYDTALRGMAQRGDIEFIEKPFTADQLLGRLQELLGAERDRGVA